jgi:hypothetical protein
LGADGRRRCDQGYQVVALTLESEQRLRDVGLINLHDQHASTWLEAAQEAKLYLAGNFPNGAIIRRDDVAKALHPVLEVNEALKQYLDENRLRGKFWIRFFGDLIIDRTWDQL